MKKIYIMVLCLCVIFCQLAISVKAEKILYEIDGYVVSYNGVEYDLSTKGGNIALVTDNPEITTSEYIMILDQVFVDIVEESIEIGNDSIQSVVVDDGWIGSGLNYFYTMQWINRSDGWNLSLKPKSHTKSNVQDNLRGWNEVVNKQSSNSHWYNAASLKGQYICHFWFAPASKVYWNISPSIPNKNAFQWIKDKCN